MLRTKTGFSQQFFGFSNTFFERPWRILRRMQFHPTYFRLADNPRCSLPLPHHLLRNDVFIQRHIQRPAHARIIKRRAGCIELIVIRWKLRRDMQFIPHCFFQLRELVNRYAIHNVDFTGLIAIYVSRLWANRQISNFINNRMPIVPVIWVTLGNDALINHPLR